MTAFFDVALRLQNVQVLPLNWWKTVPGSPDAVARVVKRCTFISNLQGGCSGRVAISVAYF